MENNTIHIKKVKIRKNALGFQIPDDYEIYEVEGNPDDIFLKKKKVSLPTSWEEFCKNYPIKEGEACISTTSEINAYDITPEVSNTRHLLYDKNLLPSRELAEAMLSLCQLIQLRDCYNNGWEPDFSNNSKKCVIYTYDNKISTDYAIRGNHVLCFKTEELRDKFLENFKDLIKIAKSLL